MHNNLINSQNDNAIDSKNVCGNLLMTTQALAVMEAALAHTAAVQQAARALSPTLSSGEEDEGPGALLQDWPTAINPDAHAASKVASKETHYGKFGTLRGELAPTRLCFYLGTMVECSNACTPFPYTTVFPTHILHTPGSNRRAWAAAAGGVPGGTAP